MKPLTPLLIITTLSSQVLYACASFRRYRLIIKIRGGGNDTLGATDDNNKNLALLRAITRSAITLSKDITISVLKKLSEKSHLPSEYIRIHRSRLKALAQTSLEHLSLGVQQWNKYRKDLWIRFEPFLKKQEMVSSVLYQMMHILQTSYESIKVTMQATVVSNESPKMTYAFVCAMALSGSSLGFYNFLYFVTLGYANAILFVMVGVLTVSHFSTSPIHIYDQLPSILVALWAIRLMAFSLHREFVSWPEWHYKMIDVDRNISYHTKVLAWLTYSPLYAAMAMPCVFRIQHAITGYEHRSWGLALGILLQVSGLLLESIADYQKAAFKGMDGNHNRKRWCNVGLYKYILYPNYFGEGMFWIGTFIGNISGYKSFFQWGISMVGLTFILSILIQSMTSLGEKQLKKYENDEAFRQFRLSHSF